MPSNMFGIMIMLMKIVTAKLGSPFAYAGEA
jgi:hypothetical protein